MKRLKRIFTVLLAAALVLGMSTAAFASDSSVTYDGDAKEFIFLPGSDESPTDLFDNFKGVMPGDEITQIIVVKNDSDSAVEIFLKSYGAAEGDEEFLSQLTLTVEAQGGSELFSAAASETEGLTDWVSLGIFESGAEVTLELTLSVPITLGNEFQNMAGTVIWEFMVEGDDDTDSPDDSDDNPEEEESTEPDDEPDDNSEETTTEPDEEDDDTPDETVPDDDDNDDDNDDDTDTPEESETDEETASDIGVGDFSNLGIYIILFATALITLGGYFIFTKFGKKEN